MAHNREHPSFQQIARNGFPPAVAGGGSRDRIGSVLRGGMGRLPVVGEIIQFADWLNLDPQGAVNGASTAERFVQYVAEEMPEIVEELLAPVRADPLSIYPGWGQRQRLHETLPGAIQKLLETPDAATLAALKTIAGFANVSAPWALRQLQIAGTNIDYIVRGAGPPSSDRTTDLGEYTGVGVLDDATFVAEAQRLGMTQDELIYARAEAIKEGGKKLSEGMYTNQYGVMNSEEYGFFLIQEVEFGHITKTEADEYARANMAPRDYSYFLRRQVTREQGQAKRELQSMEEKLRADGTAQGSRQWVSGEGPEDFSAVINQQFPREFSDFPGGDGRMEVGPPFTSLSPSTVLQDPSLSMEEQIEELIYAHIAEAINDPEFVAEAQRLGMTQDEIDAYMRERAVPYSPVDATPGSVRDLDPYGQGDQFVFAEYLDPPPGQDPAGLARNDITNISSMIPEMTDRELAFGTMGAGEQYSRFLSGLVGPGRVRGPVAQGLANILGPIMPDQYGDGGYSPYYQAMMAGDPYGVRTDETGADVPGSYYRYLQQRGARPFTRAELAQQLRDIVAAYASGADPASEDRHGELNRLFADPGAQAQIYRDYRETMANPSVSWAAGQAAQDRFTRFRNLQPEQHFLTYGQEQGWWPS